LSPEQNKRYFIKGLLPDIAPLVTMSGPATLAAALATAQQYEEGVDMVNEIEPRKKKGKAKKVPQSSEEEDNEEEEEKPKKPVVKKKVKELVNPEKGLDDLVKKFEKMQLNLVQKMEKLTSQVNTRGNNQNYNNFSRPNQNNRGYSNNF
jgi:hypothetical protein